MIYVCICIDVFSSVSIFWGRKCPKWAAEVDCSMCSSAGGPPVEARSVWERPGMTVISWSVYIGGLGYKARLDQTVNRETKSLTVNQQLHLAFCSEAQSVRTGSRRFWKVICLGLCIAVIWTNLITILSPSVLYCKPAAKEHTRGCFLRFKD